MGKSGLKGADALRAEEVRAEALAQLKPCDALRALNDLLAEADFVYLSKTAEDEPGGGPLYYLSCRRGGHAERASGETLEQVLLSLGGNGGYKTCLRCKVMKPFAEFPVAPVRKDRPEGRHSYCKVCNRERVKKYSKRRRRGCRTIEHPEQSCTSQTDKPLSVIAPIGPPPGR